VAAVRDEGIDLTPRSRPATVADTVMEHIFFFYRNPA
jgi:hypothetical protein